MLERRARRLAVVLIALAALLLPSMNGALAHPLAQDDNETTSGVEGNSYTSPHYGYTLTWPTDWSVTEEENTDDYDFLELDNGVTSVYFNGSADTATLDECVATVVENLGSIEGVSNLAQLEDSSGPAEGSEDGRAWTVYTFDYEGTDGGKSEFAEYIDCRSVVEGESILVISALVAVDDLESQLGPLQELFAGLSVTGETGPGSNGDDETPTADAGTLDDAELTQWVKVSATDIDEFWAREFPILSGGQEYQPPSGIVTFGDVVDTGCGSYQVGEIGPFYCPLDSTVYYDVSFGKYQIEQFGSASVIAVTMAHEIGHHIENLMGWAECRQTPCLNPSEMTSQEFELLADCFAGAWMADAETRGRMGSFDVETNIAQFALFLGDEGLGNTADAGAHGKGARRVFLFLTGYYNGAENCLTMSAATDPARGGASADATTTPATDNGDNGDNGNNGTDEETPTTEASGSTVEVGDDVVLEADGATLTLSVSGVEPGNSVGDLEAEGSFLAVYFSLKSDGDSAPLDYSSFVLTDSDGNEYQFSEDATDAMLKTSDDLPDGVEQVIDPGVTYNLVVIFDVPTDASGFVLSSSLSDTAVDLGE